VFAGADVEATDRARQLMTGFPPSSPSIALFQDGKIVYMIERRDIEQRTADGIADLLTLAFDKYCTRPLHRKSEPGVIFLRKLLPALFSSEHCPMNHVSSSPAAGSAVRVDCRCLRCRIRRPAAHCPADAGFVQERVVP
jgi:hypothetical protein